MTLQKKISFWGLFSISSGAMISSGIFILPSLAFIKIGPHLYIAYFLAGILALVGSLSIIELATAMPKTGGDYFFINKTFGPLLGTVSGFLGWMTLSLKSAFAIFGLSEIIAIFWHIPIPISGLFFILFFAILNIRGVENAVSLQILLVIILLILLVAFTIFGIPKVQVTHFATSTPFNIHAVFLTAGFVFISFGGLLKVTNISGEVINPKRNIPLAMISSILVITFLYTLISIVLVGTLSHETFINSLTPVADSGRIIFGKWGYVAITVASVLAFVTTANAGIMAASRYPVALSHDNLFPKRVSITHPKFHTPVLAILVTSGIIYAALFLPIETMVKSGSTVVLTSYVLTNISVIIFKESKLVNYKPTFVVPLYPWVQIFSILVFLFFIIFLGLGAVEISLLFIVVSTGFYIFYGRKKRSKESALTHLFRRIIDKKLTHHVLEDELRDILISRDNIPQDYLDELIKQSKFIDIPSSPSYESVVTLISNHISDNTELEPKMLVAEFLNNFEIYSPIVSNFSAIPHIIVPGEGLLKLIVVRSQKGIITQSHKIKIMFFIVSTQDMRKYHLKIIAAIVSLLRQQHFERKWLQARSVTELKNSILLSCRKRYF